MLCPNMKHHAFLYGVVSRSKTAELLEVAAFQLRHKSHCADIHTEDRNA